MNSLRLTCLAVVMLAGLPSAPAQGFLNLNFESTAISNGQFASTATIPGWAWNTANFVNGDSNSVPFNDIALDEPAVSLQGTNSPYYPSLQGRYSVVLQGGDFGGMRRTGAAIFQTGQIPVTALSLIYLAGSGLQVAFNGTALSPIVLSNAPTYAVWGVDVSQYAGQSGELRFSVPWYGPNSFTDTGIPLDGIRFSSTAVPEPSAVGLSCFLVLSLLGIMKRQHPLP